MRGWHEYFGQRMHIASLREVFRSSIIAVSLTIGIIGGIAGLSLGWVEVSEQAFWANTVLSVMVLLLVGWIFYREFDLSRKQKYANTTHYLNSVSRKLRNLNCRLTSDFETALKAGDKTTVARPEAYFRTELNGILDDVVSIFSLLTGTHCRAAIKVPKVEPGGKLKNAWIMSVARDSNSAAQNRQSDARRNGDRSDLLVKNTDFHMLFSDRLVDPGYYINNNIPDAMKRGEYDNTTVEIKEEQARENGITYSGFLLPYKSTVVWPIRRFMPPDGKNALDAIVTNGKQNGLGAIEQPICHGFLAIDSESRGVFNDNWDIQLGGAISEQLFETFHIFHQFVTYIKQIEDQERTK